MLLIRALTYHVPPSKGKMFEEAMKQMEDDSERFKALTDHIRTEIWTKRVVFPLIDFKIEELPKISVKIEESIKELGFDYAVIPLGRRKPKKIAEPLSTSLSGTSRIFYNLKAAELDEDPIELDLLEMEGLLKEIYEKAGPEACTRFAIAYGGPPETPYFPASSSKRRGISFCLRYAKALKEEMRSKKGDLNEIMSSLLYPKVREVRSACSEAGFEFIGFDASLSPWMDESVAEIVELMSKSSFGGPGTFSSIHKLNKAISTSSKGIKTTGFNELMLPLAEDNRLKELGGLGFISAIDLVSMISVSVAGLDMVILPLSVESKELAELLRDSMVLAFRKGKSIGIRIILADAEPLEWIGLGRFPKAPVIPIFRKN